MVFIHLWKNNFKFSDQIWKNKEYEKYGPVWFFLNSLFSIMSNFHIMSNFQNVHFLIMRYFTWATRELSFTVRPMRPNFRPRTEFKISDQNYPVSYKNWHEIWPWRNLDLGHEKMILPWVQFYLWNSGPWGQFLWKLDLGSKFLNYWINSKERWNNGIICDLVFHQ